MSFSLDMSKFAEKVTKKTDAVIRKVVLDCARSVVMMSPVDTGRFKGNWDYGVTTMPNTQYSTNDLVGNTSIRRVQTKTANVNMAGNVHYITNNLPYAERLENGWSRQAPHGMVRLTTMRFQSIVDAAARAIR